MTRHNFSKFFPVASCVVNCFQKLLSSWHDTTRRAFIQPAALLWIAFKNYYLRDTTQLSTELVSTWKRCELLSKIIIFVTRHNGCEKKVNKESVVNCFQKLLSSWHDTTMYLTAPSLNLLWIAFKNYYLRDTTQRTLTTPNHHHCCELLSKIIIFVTRHNI